MQLEEIQTRPSIAPDTASAAPGLRGLDVLVTGAGGSIGSALSMRILSDRPARLVLLDSSEQNLHDLGQSLAQRDGVDATRLVLGHAGDRGLLLDLFSRHRPRIVFHAAAYKQVPLLERQPLAALSNNVLTTRTLLEAAGSAGVERLILTSTDKAVRPRSLMGATKRLAEQLLLAHDGDALRCTAVRLVNVWGSRGSVVPRFEEQLRRGQPLTVTDERATRFFMSADEAVGLTLAAVEQGRGGDILVPRLDRPLSVLAIARKLLELGRPQWDAAEAIRITGLRPGDKLEEELSYAAEELEATRYAGIGRIAGVRPEAAALADQLRRLERAVERRDAAGAVEVLRAALPEYEPSDALLACLGAGTCR